MGEFENGRWRAGAQGLYAEYGYRVLLKRLLLNAGTFYSWWKSWNLSQLYIITSNGNTFSKLLNASFLLSTHLTRGMGP